MHSPRIKAATLVFSITLLTSGCALVPSSGPTSSQIIDTSTEKNPAGLQNPAGIQIVDVTDAVARQLSGERRLDSFTATFGNHAPSTQRYGSGDVLGISIWEAPPATLFGSSSSAGGAGGVASSVTGAQATFLPDQTIDNDGYIVIPFAGRVKAAGLSGTDLSQSIAQKLQGKANQPQVMIRLVRNATSYVTVVGDVTSSTRMDLTAGGERLLDAIATAGGVKEPVDKTTIQVTRGNTVASLPLQTIIREPRQNVYLHAGDVVTALFQPLSFTVLGASGKNDEINFEAQGITLAQALARSGGLNDSRSDPKGVFVFRFERRDALAWPMAVHTTPDGLVPVIYRVNLKDPASFFVAQSFPMSNKDLVYISNAPVAELQKFLNLVFSVALPVSNFVRN